MWKKVKLFFEKYKSYIIVFGILMLSIVNLVFQNIQEKTSIQVNGETIEINKYEGKIAVYITGEVQKPGVYYIEEGSRVNDLLKECGGITSQADLNDVNLAEKLNDADKIYIPKISAIYMEDENEVEGNSKSLININTATKEELMTLNGIGESTANSIIEYREENLFNDIEDVMNVTGIGQAKYNKIKEYICVD